MLSKYSWWPLVEHPTRIIQLLDMRLVAANLESEEALAVPVAHLMDPAEVVGHRRRIDGVDTAR